MKQLYDGTEVPERCYNYLLEFNEHNNWAMIQKTFVKTRLCRLNYNEFWTLFDMATNHDRLNHRPNPVVFKGHAKVENGVADLKPDYYETGSQSHYIDEATQAMLDDGCDDREFHTRDELGDYPDDMPKSQIP